MVSQSKISKLREVINENLRVQRDTMPIDYVNIGNALEDACSKQNHAIFARRGCGKTLLLHYSSKKLKQDIKPIYLNCEDFKRHSFPNVLIEIMTSLFREIDRNLFGWFGKKRKSKQIIKDIIIKLDDLQKSADIHDEDIRKKLTSENISQKDAVLDAKSSSISLKFSGGLNKKTSEEYEKSYKIHREKLQELDRWLPDLKLRIRDFFSLSSSTKAIIIQLDDLYHLRRTDQAFVVDYIHRLCKDLPIYFKIATLRHASNLYADRDGQPIGAQERHDYQPINIDYTFVDFFKTKSQNEQILEQFAKKCSISKEELWSLFKGEGFSRLVMAGGGVPRDVLSLFLQVLSSINTEKGEKIGKDDIRQISRTNFERKIDELKQDSKSEEQDELLRGIYVIREFCLDKKTNLFMVKEKSIQKNDDLRNLFYRLLDYRIIHNCASAITHKSQEGTYQAFSIDIGSYAHYRKLQNKMNEIDISSVNSKEQMRSSPVLDYEKLFENLKKAPENIENILLSADD